MAKILIVDDEQSIRRALRDILELEKYQVDVAIDGLDCLVKWMEWRHWRRSNHWLLIHLL